MSVITAGVAVITSFFKKGDKGGIIKQILGIFGKIKCLGGTAYPQSQYEEDVRWMEACMGYMADAGENINELQKNFNEIVCFRDTNQQNVGNMSNPCTKQRMNDFIGVCNSMIAECNNFFNYSGSINYSRWNKNWNVPRIVSLKTAPVVVNTGSNNPSSPINPPAPVDYPPVVTGTPPTQNPIGTPIGNPKTVNSGGVSTTYIPNTNGTTTVSTYNPDTGGTSQSTVPTSSLDVNLGGSVGDWSFGASNTQNRNLPIILGGIGVLAFLIFKNKK